MQEPTAGLYFIFIVRAGPPIKLKRNWTNINRRHRSSRRRLRRGGPAATCTGKLPVGARSTPTLDVDAIMWSITCDPLSKKSRPLGSGESSAAGQIKNSARRRRKKIGVLQGFSATLMTTEGSCSGFTKKNTIPRGGSQVDSPGFQVD